MMKTRLHNKTYWKNGESKSQTFISIDGRYMSIHSEQLQQHNNKYCLDDELLHRLLGGEMTNRAT